MDHRKLTLYDDDDDNDDNDNDNDNDDRNTNNSDWSSMLTMLNDFDKRINKVESSTDHHF